MAHSIRCKHCGRYQSDHEELAVIGAIAGEILEGYEFPLLLENGGECSYEPECEHEDKEPNQFDYLIHDKINTGAKGRE